MYQLGLVICIFHGKMVIKAKPFKTCSFGEESRVGGGTPCNKRGNLLLRQGLKDKKKANGLTQGFGLTVE